MSEGYSVENDVIVINRSLNDLDHFVKDFLAVLKKETKYLIVSGYISISTGRVRGTEDVDVLIPKPSLEEFKELFKKLNDAGFWCYQTDNLEDAYEYIKDLSSIRFARKNEMYPNMEVIPVTPKKTAQWYELNNPQKYKIKSLEFNGSPVEFEIAYKEERLGSQKDLEDAKHLRTMFKKILKEETIKHYKGMMK